MWKECGVCVSEGAHAQYNRDGRRQKKGWSKIPSESGRDGFVEEDESV